MKHVRVLHNDQPQAGTLDGTTITLENGVKLEASTARYLAPLEPRQIFATRLPASCRAGRACRAPPRRARWAGSSFH